MEHRPEGKNLHSSCFFVVAKTLTLMGAMAVYYFTFVTKIEHNNSRPPTFSTQFTITASWVLSLILPEVAVTVIV
jgi:hypothetical protein